MTDKEFEQVIIKTIYANSAVSSKIVPRLDDNWFFDPDHKAIARAIISHNAEWGALPNVIEIKRKLTDQRNIVEFDACMAIPDENVNTDFIMGEIEEFVRKRLVKNVTDTALEYCRIGDKKVSIADEMADAEAFTFDDKLGVDVLDDPEFLYDGIVANEKIFTTGVKTIDDMLGGGIHENSMNLIMAGCVSKDTKIKIRYKRKDSDYIYEEVEIEKVKQLLNDGYDVEVNSPDGYTKVLRYVEKGPKLMYNVTCNNKTVKASNDHLFETNDGWVLTENLISSKHTILCDDGQYHKFEITELNDIENVVDIEVANTKHRYYTNGLCSHNTNIGKTLVLCSIATSMLLAGKKVLYITFEDPELKINQRIMQNMLDVTQAQLKSLQKDAYLRMHAKAKQKCGTGKLKVIHYPEFSTNAMMINALIKDLKERQQFIPDVVFIDYIGCMIPNGRVGKDMNDNTRLLLVSMQVRALATTYHFPVISAAQVNRGGYGSSEIGLDDIADSFGQTTKADAILAITCPPECVKAGLYKVFLAKTRYGITGPTATTIGVDREKQRIYDLSVGQQSDFDDSQEPDYYAGNDDGPDINDFK